MELIFIIIGIFIVITICLPWVQFSQLSELRRRVEELEQHVLWGAEVPSSDQSLVQEESIPAKKPYFEEASIAEQEEDEFKGFENEVWGDAVDESLLDTANDPTPSSSPRISMDQTEDVVKSTFEQNMATKAPVWIGALSLICAAFFLVKYSIEAGLLGPAVRVTLGGLFGAGLLVAGQFVLKRPNIANAQRIAQGLIGAGLVALYGSVYAATHLHGLLPSLMGFGGMTFITGIAVVASLRHGQPIAVFGIIGGLLTPALLGSDNPDAITLFTYLFVLFSGVFIVLVRQGWWKLAIISLLGSFAWSSLWIITSYAPGDASTLILFAMGLTAVILSATGRRIAKGAVTEEESSPLHSLNGIAVVGGLGTIVWLGFDVSMASFDWAMIGLLSLALMALAYFDPKTYEKPLFVKMAATLGVLLFWLHDASFADALPILSGVIVLYVGVTAVIMRYVTDPRFWAIAQALSVLALYLISFTQLDMPYNISWGSVCLSIAGLAIYQASDLRKKYQASPIIQDQLVAIYALTASAFISIGLTTELPWSYAPLAIAGQIMATAWIYKKTSIDALQKIILLLAFVFIGMSYKQISLFLGMGLSSLFGDTLSTHEIKRLILDMPIIQLGGASILMYLAYWFTPRQESILNERLVKVLFVTATGLALGLGYYIFRELVHDGTGTIFENTLGFIERGVLTAVIGIAGIGVCYVSENRKIPSLLKWGNRLFAVAMFRIVYFDMILYNPYTSSSQFVGDMVVFNGLTLTYGFGALMAGWMAYKYKAWEKRYGIIALACLFAFTTLTVRQYFHGGVIEHGNVSSAELYSYSVMWLIIGVGLLTSGIRFQNKTLRMASLGFMLLTVCKVFLVDAAELEGLLRVASFLGLGVSLIGLSTFYTKFVFSREGQHTDP